MMGTCKMMILGLISLIAVSTVESQPPIPFSFYETINDFLAALENLKNQFSHLKPSTTVTPITSIKPIPNTNTVISNKHTSHSTTTSNTRRTTHTPLPSTSKLVTASSTRFTIPNTSRSTSRLISNSHITSVSKPGSLPSTISSRPSVTIKPVSIPLNNNTVPSFVTEVSRSLSTTRPVSSYSNSASKSSTMKPLSTSTTGNSIKTKSPGTQNIQSSISANILTSTKSLLTMTSSSARPSPTMNAITQTSDRARSSSRSSIPTVLINTSITKPERLTVTSDVSGLPTLSTILLPLACLFIAIW